MKLRNLFYLLLALPLFFAGCTENEEPNKPSPQQVKLELTSEASLTFDAEGGNGEISYTLENIIEGVGLTATCEANWVSDITIGDKITFAVAANEGEARDTKIVVGYSDKSFEVAIQQKAKEVLVSEYEMEDNFVEAQRISLAAYGYPNNYFYLAFLNADNTAVLSGILVGAEGENILQAGTYTTADESVYPETWALTFNDESELPFDGSDNTVVVEGNIDGYSIDFLFTDAEGKKYHFTFEGEIANMDPQGSLPTEDVNLNATHFNGEYYGTEYSDTYNYFVILSDKGLDAKGYAQAGGTYYEVDLYSVASEIDAEGYITIPAGTYTFDPNDTTAEWTIGNEYSCYSKVNEAGTGYEAESTFESGEAVVTADGITLRVVIGGYTHTVTYTGAPKIYVGLPEGDTAFEATYAYAYYFGDQFTPGSADNYYFFQSDLGLDEEGYEQANGTYYRFDIYAPLGEGTKIPAGTYTIDDTDSSALWTATSSYSAYFVLDEYAWDYVKNDYPVSGTIVVGEDGSVEAEIVMMISGATHTVTYNGGDIVIYDQSEGEGGGSEGGILSNLESDWNCNLSNHTLEAQLHGDWYEVGLQNWVFTIYPNDGAGDYVQFDVLAGANSTDNFFGEYTISDTLGTYTAYPGYSEDGFLEGAWYYKYDEEENLVSKAPMIDGWMEVVDNGDNTVTVEFDVWDDADYNITGKYTGSWYIPTPEALNATRSGAKKIANSLVVAEQKPARSKESFRVVKPAQKSAKSAAEKGLKLR